MCKRESINFLLNLRISRSRSFFLHDASEESMIYDSSGNDVEQKTMRKMNYQISLKNNLKKNQYVYLSFI